MTSRPRISALLRQQVTLDFANRCAYCQSPQEVGIPMVLDHCLPLSMGGATERENLYSRQKDLDHRRFASTLGLTNQ